MNCLQFQNIGYRLQERDILQDFNATVPQGKVSAILGPNGCGKTTLIRMACGLLYPQTGQIDILGERLGKTQIVELRKKITVVSSGAGPSGSFMGASCDTEMTLLDSILSAMVGTLGLYKKMSKQEIEEAAQWCADIGLTHRLDTPLVALSSGEQRKALFARALAQKPALMLLDEPTAGLDIAAREQFLQTLKVLSKKPDAPSMVMITHHIEELPINCEHVILMRDGTQLTQGTPKTTLTDEWLSQTFNCPIEVSYTYGRYWPKVKHMPPAPIEHTSN